MLEGVTWCDSAMDAASDADILVVVTEWNEFRGMNLSRLKRLMRRPVLCDLRNIYERETVEAAGLRHIGVGRGLPKAEAKPKPVRAPRLAKVLKMKGRVA